jgi:hypothetical protein
VDRAQGSCFNETISQRRNATTGFGAGTATLFSLCRQVSASGSFRPVLSPLERRSTVWDIDPDSVRQSLSATVSLVVRLLGRDPDPASSREHVLLALLAERRLLAGENAEIGTLMRDVLEPPLAEVRALPVNSFLKKKERGSLAAALNTLLAAPTFSSWRGLRGRTPAGSE